MVSSEAAGSSSVNREAHEPDPADGVVDQALVPPDTLFHYTDADGLLGIVGSGHIWASDTAFLSDSQEVIHGFKILEQELIGFKRSHWNKELAELIVGLRTASHSSRVMSASFCANGDLLSQWRGYARDQGYALGIDTSRASEGMESRSESPGFMPVFYDSHSAAAFARVCARRIVDKWQEEVGDLTLDDLPMPRDPGTIDRIAKVIYELNANELARSGAVLAHVKNPSFSEECEWRVVRTVWPGGVREGRLNGMEFRAGPRGLLPYVPVDLRGPDGRLPISEIVVGPGPDVSLRAEGVRLLLAERGYRESVTVRVSEVPFRG